MTTNAFYTKTISQMPPGLERKVLDILVHHVGAKNRISRQALVEFVFRTSWRNDSTEDRQVREAIACLQRSHVIISDSGKGGYYMAGSLEEAASYIAEIVSRANELSKKAASLRAIAEAQFSEVRQMELGI